MGMALGRLRRPFIIVLLCLLAASPQVMFNIVMISFCLLPFAVIAGVISLPFLKPNRTDTLVLAIAVMSVLGIVGYAVMWVVLFSYKWTAFF
jgi:hypothetical protein